MSFTPPRPTAGPSSSAQYRYPPQIQTRLEHDDDDDLEMDDLEGHEGPRAGTSGLASRAAGPRAASPNGYAPLNHPNGLRSALFFDQPDPFDPPSGKQHPLMRTLYDLLEDPTSSQSAFAIHVFTTSLIIISAIITILETLPPFARAPSGLWFGLETALVVCFTVEFACRAYAHSASWSEFWRWLWSFFAIVDLLAVVPYYVEIAIQADTTAFFRFSILRTFRLLRVFRPFKYSSTILLTIEVMYLSMKRSKDALFALFFFALVVLVVFSTLLYFAERGTWDEALETFIDVNGDPSEFASIPGAAWFVLVTITTVGYGEMLPHSILGRLFTLPLLLFGLLLIALPSFVLGREFSALWETMAQKGGLENSHTRQDSLAMFINTNSSPIRSRMPLPPRKRNAPSSQRGGSTPVIEFDAAEGSPSTGAPPRSGYATPEPASSSSARLRHAPGTSRSGDASGLSRQSEQALSRQIDELGAMLREMREEMRVLREERSLSSAGRS